MWCHGSSLPTLVLQQGRRFTCWNDILLNILIKLYYRVARQVNIKLGRVYGYMRGPALEPILTRQLVLLQLRFDQLSQHR